MSFRECMKYGYITAVLMAFFYLPIVWNCLTLSQEDLGLDDSIELYQRLIAVFVFGSPIVAALVIVPAAVYAAVNGSNRLEDIILTELGKGRRR